MLNLLCVTYLDLPRLYDIPRQSVSKLNGIFVATKTLSHALSWTPSWDLLCMVSKDVAY